MKRILKHNEKVWFTDGLHSGWGKISLPDRIECIFAPDEMVLVKKDSGGEQYLPASQVYSVAHGYKYLGGTLCWEHDEMIAEEFYDPQSDTNLSYYQVDNKEILILSEPHTCEFYTVEDDQIHISGYLWHDSDRGWVLTTFVGCYVPKAEVLAKDDGLRRQFVIAEYEQDVRQYEQDNLTTTEAYHLCNHYFGDKGMILLDYEKLSDKTTNGRYVTLIR